jgi:hypothetical protein
MRAAMSPKPDAKSPILHLDGMDVLRDLVDGAGQDAQRVGALHRDNDAFDRVGLPVGDTLRLLFEIAGARQVGERVVDAREMTRARGSAGRRRR